MSKQLSISRFSVNSFLFNLTNYGPTPLTMSNVIIVREGHNSDIKAVQNYLTLHPKLLLSFLNFDILGTPSNIEYIEIKIPKEWPVNINKFIPNVYYLPRLDSSHICR